MSELAARPRPRGAARLALLAAGLALVAACRARDGARGGAPLPMPAWEAEVARLDSLPAIPSALPGRDFWVGAWVGPPPPATDAATWLRYGAAGLDVTMVPLEDRYRRSDNRARLAALDALAAAGEDTILAFVRDDALHPDESARPGWEARLDSVVQAYQGFRSLAGIFLADEPAPEAIAAWAPLARRLGRADPLHPAYVNFAELPSERAADPAARARWRDDLVRAVEEGELRFFTVGAYPFRAGGETPNFLATLREAARASHATGRPFGAVLQWTGHGPLRAPTAAEASYLALQAIGHGATSLVWFTYWTPDPREEPWRWHGGAIEYDGRVSARHDTLAALDRVARRAAAWRGPRPMLVFHAGSGLPPGLDETPGRAVPGLSAIDGGPLSVAFGGREPDGVRRYLVIDRGRVAGNRVRLVFVDGTGLLEVTRFTDPGETRRIEGTPDQPPVLELDLEPGGALGVLARGAP